MANALCWGCRGFKEIYFAEEETGRNFCETCTAVLPPSTEQMQKLFLLLTIPFKVGDYVETRTAGVIYDGTGVIDFVSTSLEHGGTVVYPTFHVALDHKAHDKAPDDAWYTESCLTKITKETTV